MNVRELHADAVTRLRGDIDRVLEQVRALDAVDGLLVLETATVEHLKERVRGIRIGDVISTIVLLNAIRK